MILTKGTLHPHELKVNPSYSKTEALEMLFEGAFKTILKIAILTNSNVQGRGVCLLTLYWCTHFKKYPTSDMHV